METDAQMVAVSAVAGGYPTLFPFDPQERFPEYRGAVSSAPNSVYHAVRRSFQLLGFDRANYGKSSWNPLNHLVKPGNRVFIKPNLCSHEYGRKKETLAGDLFSVITHPSVVRAVADYVAIALHGHGEIIIGDNPTIDANFAKLMDVTHLNQFAEFYRKNFGVRCSVRDLREVWCDDLNHYGNQRLMSRLPGDPEGDTVVNLGGKSFFYGLNPLLFRGVFTNRWDTIRHHHGSRQEYAIANSIYQSDVYISIPKLKTHHKVGATLNIKGLVGICTKKNYLVHWRIGYPSWGGDEYPESKCIRDHLLLAIKHLAIAITPERLGIRIAERFKDRPLERCFRAGSYRGSWEGNDTCWRMAADLYLALMSRSRRTLSVIDGVIGGDQNGPFCTGRQESQTIICGEDLVLTDAVAVRLMDFNVWQIRYLRGLLDRLGIDLARVHVISEDYNVQEFFTNERPYLQFRPPSAWPHLQLNITGG